MITIDLSIKVILDNRILNNLIFLYNYRHVSVFEWVENIKIGFSRFLDIGCGSHGENCLHR